MRNVALAAILAAALSAAAFAQETQAPGCKESCGGCQDAPKTDAPKPEAAPEAKQEPAKPETPPEAAPEKKRKKGPLGLPDLRTLRETLALSNDQFKQAKELYESYEDKVKEAEAKAKENPDKRAARKELKPLRDEIAAKLKDLCTEEQKPKLDELLAPPRKKKEAPPDAQK